uniref:Putative ovule protein n=1 Tax=Solanum chacoense TaxID=4108 RepID=A0A0V0GYK2_SOLCH
MHSWHIYPDKCLEYCFTVKRSKIYLTQITKKYIHSKHARKTFAQTCQLLFSSDSFLVWHSSDSSDDHKALCSIIVVFAVVVVAMFLLLVIVGVVLTLPIRSHGLENSSNLKTKTSG